MTGTLWARLRMIGCAAGSPCANSEAEPLATARVMAVRTCALSASVIGVVAPAAPLVAPVQAVAPIAATQVSKSASVDGSAPVHQPPRPAVKPLTVVGIEGSTPGAISWGPGAASQFT